MARAFYIGVDGKARKAKKMYIGVDGKAREVKRVYVGVDGKAKLVYRNYTPVTSIKLTWGDISQSVDTRRTVKHDDDKWYSCTSSVTITPDILPKDATKQNVAWSISIGRHSTWNYVAPFSYSIDGNSCTLRYSCTTNNAASNAYYAKTYGYNYATVTATTPDGLRASVTVYASEVRTSGSYKAFAISDVKAS